MNRKELINALLTLSVNVSKRMKKADLEHELRVAQYDIAQRTVTNLRQLCLEQRSKDEAIDYLQHLTANTPHAINLAQKHYIYALVLKHFR